MRLRRQSSLVIRPAYSTSLRESFSVLVATRCFAFPTIASAQEALNKPTAMDDFQIQLASAPAITPDGKKIAYVRGFADSMTDRRYSNLWIVSADGTDHRPLTTGDHVDSSPFWSPDGIQQRLSDKIMAAQLQ